MKKKTKVFLLSFILVIAVYLLAPIKIYKYFVEEDFIYIEIKRPDFNNGNRDLKSYWYKAQKGTKEYQKVMSIINNMYCHRAWDTGFSNTINYGETSVTLYTKRGKITLTDSREMFLYGHKYLLWNKSSSIIQEFEAIVVENND